MTPIQITAVQLDSERTIIAYSDGLYYIKCSDGIFRYEASEMIECYNLTEEDLDLIKSTL